ncbi:MAG: endonuclease [Ignavibacteria bacterium]|nr:endonuclease [Ignavibacteria bacterium]
MYKVCLIFCKKLLAIFFILFIYNSGFSQYNPVLIYYDTVLTNVQVGKNFYLKNPTPKPITINSFRTTTSKFFCSFLPITINPFDSVLITVYFKTNQNITYKDFLIFETKGLNSSIINYSLATARYPDTLYKFTQGLIDENLKAALLSFTQQNYISLGYNLARDKMFEYIDDYNNDDTIECVYTGVKIKAANRTEAQNQGFNTEHTWPQSYFNSAEPMRSDLFHLYPTLATANNARSDYHFGIVVSNITWQQGGSKRGFDYQNEIVFEPRDVHKGNVARSIFYFAVRFGNQGNYLAQKEENVLRLWNMTDTVDQKERTRNQRIKSFQNIFNPFIDHPEFIDRIRSFYSIAPTIFKGRITVSPFSITFDTLAVNDTVSYYLAIMNYGNSNLSISSITSNMQEFIVESYPTSVPANELRYAKIKFKPTAINQTYNGLLTIYNSDSLINVSLKGFSNSNIGLKKINVPVPINYKLTQNYPNPFNSLTKFRIEIPENKSNLISLTIYDLSGRKIANLFTGFLNAGTYEYELDVRRYQLCSGIYFIELKAFSHYQIIKISLIN